MDEHVTEVHRTEHFVLEKSVIQGGANFYIIRDNDNNIAWENHDVFETLDTWINLHRLEDVDGGIKKFLESVDEMREAHKNATSDIAMPQAKSLLTPGNKKLN